MADAWHWFEPEHTITELRRVLRPGGWLGLVWNVTAEPVEPWEHVLANDSDDYDRRSKASNDGLNTRLSSFDHGELEFHHVEWTWDVTPWHWASLRATTSMAIAMTPEDGAAAFAATLAKLQEICSALGTDTVPVRQIPSCVRWTPGS